MNPWLIFWAPQLTLPFGGSVAQRIEPNTNWFFDSIGSSAGDGSIERKAFEVASYGRQLGLITEVLVDLAAQVKPATPGARRSLERLQRIQARIEQIKEQDADDLLTELDAVLQRLKKHHGDRLVQARRRIEHTLSAAEA